MKYKWLAVAVPVFLSTLNLSNLQAQERPAPDNTKVNKTAKPTADQAGNSAVDRDLMQKIRKAVMDDKSLSTTAHNVKIIAKDGKVTLKGPVKSAAEKAAIERLAADAAGAANVTNQITVAGKAAGSKKPKTKTI